MFLKLNMQMVYSIIEKFALGLRPDLLILLYFSRVSPSPVTQLP